MWIGPTMFSEEELDGCCSPHMEDWLEKREDAIRLIAENGSFVYKKSSEECLRRMMELFNELYGYARGSRLSS